MVGTVSSANSRFSTYGTQVSAHYGVGLDGRLYHWLEEFLVAYHSGSWSMNCRSIGIEHEDGGNYNGTRPDALYASSAKLVADICKFYSIPCDRQHILKHSEVIPTGCPDALDIDRIIREAYEILHPPVPMDTINIDIKARINGSYTDDEFKSWLIAYFQGKGATQIRSWLRKILGV
jgi:hypothetical protein